MSQLSTLHTQLLVLGMLVFLVVLALEDRGARAGDVTAPRAGGARARPVTG